MNRRVAALAASTLVAAFGACSQDVAGDGAPTTSPKVQPREFIVIDHGLEDAYWDSALIKGRLELENGCLTIIRPGVTLVAVWTSEYSWDPATSTVSWEGSDETPGWLAGQVRVGDRVRFGGGIQPDNWETQNTDVRNRPLLSSENIEQINSCLENTGADSWSFLTPPEGT